MILNIFIKQEVIKMLRFDKYLKLLFINIKIFMFLNLKQTLILRSQIRLMVGFLLAINSGKQSIKNLKEQLNLTHHHFKTPAIANGLYLAKIKY